MSIFDGKRIPKERFQVDHRIRNGHFTDAYFKSLTRILTTLAKEGYTFKGQSDLVGVDCRKVENGNLVVEMQFFTRRKPFSLIAGVDEALAILEECTGYFDDQGAWVSTFANLDIEAVHDGTFAHYDGDPLNIQPILKIRGRYRDFANLETVILGVLAEATRVATNVYNTLVATRGKDVLFFPARFAHYKLQALHGYAYSLAVQAYNQKYGKNSKVYVSTDDQGEWWGGKGGGTIAHASICCFLGDTAETMLQFARIIDPDVSRVVLVDFHNDCVAETLKVMDAMWNEWYLAYVTGNQEDMQRYKLSGVRPDTSGNMRDASVEPLGDKKLDCGVNPRLVWNLRKAIDNAWQAWGLKSSDSIEAAKQWCKDVGIVVTGGFTVEKIKKFEELGVPVQTYGVGSGLLVNNDETNNDFTADIVRAEINGQWHKLVKVGRQPCDNPNLILIQGKKIA